MREDGKQRMSKWDQDPNEKPRSSLEAAAEAAAKVNAMLIAKGKLKPTQISNAQSNKQKHNTPTSSNSMVVAEVDINDVPVVCRNLLTRGVTQDDISKTSGAAVSTRGRYMMPEERKTALPTDRPLYLCVQGPSQESVDKAVCRITDIISNTCRQTSSVVEFSTVQALEPQAVDVKAHMPTSVLPMSTQPTGLAFVQEKLFIGLEHAPPSFDVKNKILGPHGSYLHHIQAETGAKVMLRGKGSDFIEPMSGREAFEPMHIYIQHPTLLGLQQAKQLALNLIQTVQQDYAQFQQALAALPPTISPGTATLLAGLQQQSQLGLTLVGTSMSSPLSVIPVSASALGQPALGLAIAPTVGLTSLSPGQTVLLDTSVPPPAAASTVTHFQPSCTEPQTITLGVIPTSVSSIMVDTSIPPPNFPCLEGPPVHHPLLPIRPQHSAGSYVLPAVADNHIPEHLMLPPGLSLPPQPGSSVSPSFQPSSMIAQTRPTLVQPLTTVLPPAQSVIQVQQIPQLQIVMPSGQPTTAQVLNTMPPQALQRPPDHLDMITKTLPSPAVEGMAYAPPPPASSVQAYYSQYVPSTVSPVTCAVATGSSSATVSVEQQTSFPRESSSHKRRFREEKDTGKVPGNLLGYQHGPLHKSIGTIAGSTSKQSAATVTSASLCYTPSSARRKDELPTKETFAVPPPPPVSLSKAVEPKKRAASSSDTGASDKKKLKGALGTVAASKEDAESEDKQSVHDQQHNVSSLRYNHYSGKPMMYGEEDSGQLSMQQDGFNPSVMSSASLGGDDQTGALQPSYTYQIQHSQQPTTVQYGQYYGQTMSTPPPLPQHTTLLIQETPVSVHQFASHSVQPQQSSNLTAPSLPTIVQHPTVYIQESQVTLPGYAPHPVPATVYLQDLMKQPPPGLPPPLSSMQGQPSVFMQETVQHTPLGIPPPAPPPGTGHQSTVILQESAQPAPQFVAPPPGTGQQSTIYVHETAITNSRILPPPQSPAIQQQTIYLQDTGGAVPPTQTFMQAPAGAAHQQSTIIIHETALPSQQYVSSCPPPNLSSALPPPHFVPPQHNVILQPSIVQTAGSQSVYGQLAYTSDFNNYSSYAAHQNALQLPPTSSDGVLSPRDTSYWMPCS